MTPETIAPSATLEPEQLALIQSVYDDLISETWFHDTEDNRAALGGLVIRTFLAGKTAEFDLLETCHEAAKDRFRRP